MHVGSRSAFPLSFARSSIVRSFRPSVRLSYIPYTDFSLSFARSSIARSFCSSLRLSYIALYILFPPPSFFLFFLPPFFFHFPTSMLLLSFLPSICLSLIFILSRISILSAHTPTPRNHASRLFLPPSTCFPLSFNPAAGCFFLDLLTNGFSRCVEMV